jgi:hypothetical protein
MLLINEDMQVAQEDIYIYIYREREREKDWKREIDAEGSNEGVELRRWKKSESAKEGLKRGWPLQRLV